MTVTAMNSEQAKIVLAFTVLFFSLLMLLGLFFFDIPAGNKDLINTFLGALLGWSGAVISFYFGSSDRDSKEKTSK